MPTHSCNAIIAGLSQWYGPATIIGQEYRWRVGTHDPEVDFLIGLCWSSCFPIKVWVSDPLEPGLKGLHEFRVCAATQVQPILQQITDLIGDMQEHSGSRSA